MAAGLFSQYIRDMKRQARNAGFIVLGNQGADLDSIASALALAWHLAGQQPEKIIVPLIAKPRHGSRLRPEVRFVLAKAGINPDDLLFTDDVELDKLLQQGAGLILVDHNSLETTSPSSTPGVTAIIDHHHDGGAFPDAEPRIIAEVGSTATLIGELILGETGEMELTPGLLLLSAILMDTANLSDKAGRSTDRDQNMAVTLLTICGVEREIFFTSLQQAQYDLAGLSSAELLASDYKEWPSRAGDYGMSTVLVSLSRWQQREAELGSVIAQFALRKKLSILIVMMASHGPDFQRELILFCRHREIHLKLEAYLRGQGLDLSTVQGVETMVDGGGFMGMYRQGNVLISRKKLQPLVHSFLSGPLVAL